MLLDEIRMYRVMLAYERNFLFPLRSRSEAASLSGLWGIGLSCWTAFRMPPTPTDITGIERMLEERIRYLLFLMGEAGA